MAGRPQGREKKTGGSGSVYKKGSGLNLGGAVGNQGRPGGRPMGGGSSAGHTSGGYSGGSGNGSHPKL